jgi:hypothetical protein
MPALVKRARPGTGRLLAARGRKPVPGPCPRRRPVGRRRNRRAYGRLTRGAGTGPTGGRGLGVLASRQPVEPELSHGYPLRRGYCACRLRPLATRSGQQVRSGECLLCGESGPWPLAAWMPENGQEPTFAR